MINRSNMMFTTCNYTVDKRYFGGAKKLLSLDTLKVAKPRYEFQRFLNYIFCHYAAGMNRQGPFENRKIAKIITG